MDVLGVDATADRARAVGPSPLIVPQGAEAGPVELDGSLGALGRPSDVGIRCPSASTARRGDVCFLVSAILITATVRLLLEEVTIPRHDHRWDARL